MKQVRVDVNATKRIQAAVASLPQTSNTFASLLADIVAQQSDIIVGLSSVVRLINNSFFDSDIHAFFTVAPAL